MRRPQKDCERCQWHGQCDRDVRCEYYTPEIPDLPEEDLEELIETRKIKFRAEFFEYAEELEIDF